MIPSVFPVNWKNITVFLRGEDVRRYWLVLFARAADWLVGSDVPFTSNQPRRNKKKTFLNCPFFVDYRIESKNIGFIFEDRRMFEVIHVVWLHFITWVTTWLSELIVHCAASEILKFSSIWPAWYILKQSFTSVSVKVVVDNCCVGPECPAQRSKFYPYFNPFAPRNVLKTPFKAIRAVFWILLGQKEPEIC